MLVRVGCQFDFDATWPTAAVMLVGASHADVLRIVEEDTLVDPQVPLRTYCDAFGNTCWRLLLPEGHSRLIYDALVEIDGGPDPSVPDAPQTPVDTLPDDTLQFTLPSRHCQSDLLSDAA